MSSFRFVRKAAMLGLAGFGAQQLWTKYGPAASAKVRAVANPAPGFASDGSAGSAPDGTAQQEQWMSATTVEELDLDPDGSPPESLRS